MSEHHVRNPLQKGGKFLGSGVAGCVFKPHLKCVTISNKKNSIGKVFNDNDEYDNELAMTRIIQKIDPQGLFTLHPIETCNEIHYYRHNDEVSKCKLIDKNMSPKIYKQIIYPYGGKTLDSLMSKNKGSITAFCKVFAKFKPILEGIYKFNNRHPSPSIVHLDIKPQNILVSRSKLFLIDFGLLSAHDEVYQKDRVHILSSDYPWYPPEFKTSMFKGDFNVLFRRVSDNFEKVEPAIGKAIINILKMNPKQDLYDFYQAKVPKKQYIEFVNKVDIYSLGIVLLQLYLWSNYHRKTYVRPSKYNTIRNKVLELLKGMINFDPRKRLSIDQVISKYNEILTLLE